MPKAPQKLSEQVIKRAQQGVSERLGFEINREIIVASQDDPPKIPDFPTHLVLINLLLDVLSLVGSIASLTGVGIFIYWALKIIVWIANFFYFFGKAGPASRAIKKVALRRAIFLLLTFILTDPIPFNDIFAPNFLLIILIHYRETKIVKAFLFAFGEFKDEELPKQLQQALRDSDVVSSNVVRRARNPRPSN